MPIHTIASNATTPFRYSVVNRIAGHHYTDRRTRRLRKRTGRDVVSDDYSNLRGYERKNKKNIYLITIITVGEKNLLSRQSFE